MGNSRPVGAALGVGAIVGAAGTRASEVGGDGFGSTCGRGGSSEAGATDEGSCWAELGGFACFSRGFPAAGSGT